MSLPTPDERRLREIERELDADETLAALAKQVGQRSRRRKVALPAPRLGWLLAMLLSVVGLLVLTGGIASGTIPGLLLGLAFAVLFQGPLVTMFIARWRARRRRAPE